MWRAAGAAAVVATLAGLALLVVLLLSGTSPEPDSSVLDRASPSASATSPGGTAGVSGAATPDPAGAALDQALEPPEAPGALPGEAGARSAEAGSSRKAEGTEPEKPGETGRGPTLLGSEPAPPEEQPPRSGNWVLDPEIHQRILEELPERDEVPYLSMRILKLVTQTLRYFPTEDRAVRLEARRRVGELRRRIAERKLETRGDLEALEALRSDLLQLDRELEVWRGRVLQGEAVLPEFSL